MPRAIIVHCWEGNSVYCWYPWVQEQLKKEGFEVIVPDMPETQFPRMETWVPFLANLIGEPNSGTYLIGHSIGTVVILRYLETLQIGQKIGGAVLVAGFTDSLGYKELENFFSTPFDFQKIKTHCQRFVDIASDNDPYVPLTHADILRDQLGARMIVKHDAKHFSGAGDGEESCTQLPEVVTSVVEIAKGVLHLSDKELDALL